MPNSNSVKQERRNQLDPKSQGLVSSVPQLPGGPPNNPMNDNTIFSEPPTTMDPSGMSQTPNGQYTNSQSLVQTMPPSGQPQNVVNGRANNSMFPYGIQPQSNFVFTDKGQSQLLAGQLGQKAFELGLNEPGTLSPMGPIGRMTAPGAFPPEASSQSASTLTFDSQGGGGGGKGTSRGDQNGGSRTA